MNFSIIKEEILGELQLFQGIIEKRNTMPILANILINAVGNELELTGTDLEVGLSTHFPARVEDEGSITISGKKLFEIVKSLPEKENLNFREDGDLLMRISSGESEFKVLCLPKDDYPKIPEAKFERKIQLPLNNLKEMIDCVYYTITQEQRYYLNGALMVIKDKNLELITTDGHRLAYTSLLIEKLNMEDEIRIIISKKALNELRKFEDETIEFDFDENNLFFRVNKRTLISRIIEGKFPNYEAVIPRNNENIMSVSKNKIMDSLRRVSLLSTERSKGVRLNIEKDRMTLFSSNPEIGEAKDKISINYKGEGLEIGFNFQYLLDFLSTVKSENVKIELKDKSSAVLLKPEEDDIKYIYVLMPMEL